MSTSNAHFLAIVIELPPWGIVPNLSRKYQCKREIQQFSDEMTRERRRIEKSTGRKRAKRRRK